MRKQRIKGQVVTKEVESVVGYAKVENALKTGARRKGGAIFLPIGRNGEIRRIRNYSLSEEKLAALLANWQETDVFPSPYVKSRLTDLLGALVSLGINKAWPLYLVRKEMQEIMSKASGSDGDAFGKKSRVKDGVTDWERFIKAEKKKRGEVAVDVDRRIMWIATSLRKRDREKYWNPVGRRLEQMGCCVDIFRVSSMEFGNKRDVVFWLRLNTRSTEGLLVTVSHERKIPKVVSGETLGPACTAR